MRAIAVSGSIPTKRVTVVDITPEDSVDEILECAMEYARESRSSLFGWDVTREPDWRSAVVALYTD